MTETEVLANIRRALEELPLPIAVDLQARAQAIEAAMTELPPVLRLILYSSVWWSSCDAYRAAVDRHHGIALDPGEFGMFIVQSMLEVREVLREVDAVRSTSGDS